MHMKKTLLSLLAASSLIAVTAQAQTIVDDNFADLDRTKTGALDADWWSSSSTSGNSVEIDATGLGLVSGTSGRGIHATFTPTTLAIGDTITATVNFTTPTTIGSGASPFRFAWMDFNNAGLAADLLSASGAGNENPLYVGQPGYMVDLDVNTGATSDFQFREHDTASTLGRFLGTTTEWINLGSSAPDLGYTFAANSPYTVTYAISLTVTGMTLNVSLIDGASTYSYSAEDTSGLANNFGMFGIWVNSNIFGSTTASDPDNGITLTNFKVELTTVPEPATYAAILGLAVLGFVAYRRRRA